MAAVAPVLFPEMKQRGAKEGDLVALLSATGAQTETIPPSIVLITIGSVTGISIAALFTGGLLPGVVLAITLCMVVRWRYRHEDLSHVTKASLSVIWKSLLVALPAIALPFVIRAAVIEGVATATEVSTIGIAYSIAAGLLIYRQFDWRRLRRMLVETASLSGGDLADYRHRDRDGMGTDPIGILARACESHDGIAGGRDDIHGGLDRRLHYPGQCAGRHSCNCAVRSVVISHRQGGGNSRGALRDGRDPGDGNRPVRATLRRRILRRLRNRTS